MGYTRSLLGVVILASVSIGAHAAQDAMTSEQWMDRMQRHWQQVITADDPAKRKELLRRHEELMDKAAAEGDMGPGHMEQDGHHMDLMNSIDMHRDMMDMIR